MFNGDPIQLLDLTRDELQTLLGTWGQPPYRASQIRHWLYRQLVADPAQMTNLPAGLRNRLADQARIELLTPVTEISSSDGHTTKGLFRLHDGHLIETVLMAYRRGYTVCISSQAGCAMGCTFCATAQMGLQRNLTAGEIVAQVLFFERRLRERSANSPGEPSKPVGISNVVVMGMGEPLANYRNLWRALRNLVGEDGFGMGARRITVSTVGLVPGIERFAQEGLQVNLAVSLHAADDVLRSQLVPVNHRYPIAQLMAACQRYVERTHRRITFEYALMRGINDSRAQALALADRLNGLLCHVNLIPLNPVLGSPFQPSLREDVETFVGLLRSRGVSTTLRVRRGIDIDAGCGQLRARVVSEGP
jgi:23S rRNA (adenine2503-C2)-methyltransferase